MELSRIITHLGRRFRETKTDAHGLGGAIGYTIAQTAQLVETASQYTNDVTAGGGAGFQRQLGFARQFGVDPGQTIRSFGNMGRLSGGEVSNDRMAQSIGVAISQNMDKGRLGAFLQSSSQLTQQMFSQTGKMADPTQVLNLQRMAFDTFGDERGRGGAGADFVGRLQGVMTQGGPMRAFMQRAMGFGQEGGPGYIEMRERQDAGVFDARNLVDMFSYFQDRGYGEGGMFRAIEGVAGGNLKAAEIKALVTHLGSAEGLLAYGSGASEEGSAGIATFIATLSEAEKGEYAKKGMFGLGTMPGRISMAEGRAMQMESMQMTVGAPVAEAMVGMTDVISNLAKSASDLIGMDLGTVLTEGVSALKQLTALGNKLTGTMKPENTLAGMSAEGGGNLSLGMAVVRQGGAKAGAQFFSGLYDIRMNPDGDESVPSFVTDEWARSALELKFRGNGGGDR